jgi:alkylation response protein AidB-like acyl-CoA dehydrogenase
VLNVPEDHPLDDVPAAAELADYRATAREWLRANMPPLDPDADPNLQPAARLKDLARRLHDGGYSGICFPTSVGGAGLTREHHRVFCEEAAVYELPVYLGNPGLSIIAPPIMEFGTPDQQQHVAAMLRGERLFVQMMSEPSGGSDMAGALTRADRDGDVWILNGSKIWSSGAWRADWGLVLVRTNWDVPKHRGLSLFLLDLSLPGITVNTIRMVDGTEEFCEEFFDDVVVPHGCLLGEPNDGWTVASRLLFHERQAVGGGSPYNFNRPRSARRSARGVDLLDLARRHGRTTDPVARQLIGEAHANERVGAQLIDRVSEGVASGALPAIAGSLLRLNSGVTAMRRSSIAVELAGRDGVTWTVGDDRGHAAEQFIARQAACIGGGTIEMQRNLISERLLGMPREPAADRDVPFREVGHARRKEADR